MPKAPRDLPVIAFSSQQAFDVWLASQPGDCRGLWLKVAKKSSGIASISRAEAVDSALCHGWIDGQLDSFDSKYWLIRFTPRWVLNEFVLDGLLVHRYFVQVE